ncbi:MAG TPA: hypothetical protein VGI39_03515 [Polyangiaceae bacterium]|jgi:hypothetical protein
MSLKLLSLAPVLCTLAACAASPPAAAPTASEACVGISDADMAGALNQVRANVTAVTPKNTLALETKGAPAQKLEGAILSVRATPSMTSAWLTRVLECDGARGAATCASHGPCPLVHDGATVETTRSDGAFSIEIVSRDPTVARSVLARAQEWLAAR